MTNTNESENNTGHAIESTKASGSSPPVEKTVLIDSISLPKWKGRGVNASAVETLAASVVRDGLINAVTVRRVGEAFELVAGRHRLEAARKAGLRDVRVTIVDADDRRAESLGLVENLRRRNLSADEVAESMARLVALEGGAANSDHERAPSGGVSPRNKGVTAVARKTGKSKAAISKEASRKKKAHPKVWAAHKAKKISAGHVDELNQLDADTQVALLPEALDLTRDQLRARVADHRRCSEAHPTSPSSTSHVASVAPTTSSSANASLATPLPPPQPDGLLAEAKRLLETTKNARPELMDSTTRAELLELLPKLKSALDELFAAAEKSAAPMPTKPRRCVIRDVAAPNGDEIIASSELRS